MQHLAKSLMSLFCLAWVAGCGGGVTHTGSNDDGHDADCVDEDGDGYGEGCNLGPDCDDTPQTGATCHSHCLTFYADNDGDGFGDHNDTVVRCEAPAGYVDVGGDCDPSSSAHWDDCETCVDVDGDGYGEGCNLGPDCDDTLETGATCHSDCPTFYADNDGDGFGDHNDTVVRCEAPAGYVDVGGDCDDTTETGASCHTGCSTFYADNDDDGFGDDYDTVVRCEAPVGYVDVGGDCDSSSGAHWDDCETCVDVDGDSYGEGCNLGPDCDDTLETGATCHSGCQTFYRDEDGDGFGDDLQTLERCSAPEGYAGAGGDCNDADENNWESCDTCRDLDGDGYFAGCDAYVGIAGPDCDDADILTFPGAIDLPDDGKGQNCGEPDVVAADGVGIYVDAAYPDCESSDGTMGAPYCEISSALSGTAPFGSYVFVAQGEYDGGVFVASRPVFGGYDGANWSRNIDVNETVIAATSEQSYAVSVGSGGMLQGVVMENNTDCGSNCTGISVAYTRAWLVDVTVRTAGAGTSCVGVLLSTSGVDVDLVMVRANIAAEGCTEMSYGLRNRGNYTVTVLDSAISGSSVTVSNFSLGAFLSTRGKFFFENTSITGGGGNTTNVQGINSQTTDGLTVIRSRVVGTTGSAATSYGVLHRPNGGYALITNSFIDPGAGSTHSTGVRLGGSDSAVTMINNTIFGGFGNDAAGVRDIGSSAMTCYNNIIEARNPSGLGLACPMVLTADSTAWLHNNNLHGDDCLVDIAGTELTDIAQVNACTWATCQEAAENISVDPSFAADGLHLEAGSACIDAGTDPPAELPIRAVGFDLDGEIRPDAGGIFDIGADEVH